MKAPLIRSINVVSVAYSAQSTHSKPYRFSVHMARSHFRSVLANQFGRGSLSFCLSSVNQLIEGYFFRCSSINFNSELVINFTPSICFFITGGRFENISSTVFVNAGDKRLSGSSPSLLSSILDVSQ
jgi:hypothetical protein